MLFGLTSSIFTPYRLGEYLGRPLFISEQNRVSSVFALFIGSLAQSMVTIGMAVTGLFLFESKRMKPCPLASQIQPEVIELN